MNSARSVWTLAVCGLLLAPFSQCRAQGIPLAVKTDSGLVEGVPALEPGVRAFQGIPYAAPPVGDLRWKPPQPAAPWPNVRNADRFGPACMQNYMGPLSTANFGDYETKSEDCLYLNIWTPAKSSGARLPVLVWIHGGGFFVGSGAERLHHGDHLAAKGVIVVTFNYRLNIFGFFAHPQLTAESEHHSSGNYGLMDQIAALQWVRRNIAAFGGDPDKVTIFGESAGAGAVSCMQASPLTKGLFRGAIGESGGQFSAFGPGGQQGLRAAETSGERFARSLGVDNISTLRAMTADQLLRASANNPLGSTGQITDGYVLPEDVYTLFAKGKQQDVPVLVGSNANEGRTLRFPPPKMSDPDLQAGLDRLYPSGRQDEVMGAMMLWTAHTWAHLETTTGTHKAYEYYFDHAPPFPSDQKFESDVSNLGAFHSSEIIYVFNNLDIRKARSWPWTPEDYKLADMMSSYWVNFATNGDPNGPGLPIWSAYSDKHPEVLHVADPVQSEPLPRTNELQLWDRINLGTK